MSLRKRLQAKPDDGTVARAVKWVLKYGLEAVLVAVLAAGVGLVVEQFFTPTVFLGFRIDGNTAAVATFGWFGWSERCFLTDDEPF